MNQHETTTPGRRRARSGGSDRRVGQQDYQLDFIRGIAVMGILAANIVSFGQPFAAYMYPDAFLTGHSAAEESMWIAQFVLIDGKMQGLFTLLFGAGLYLFMERARAWGEGRLLQARRLFWLLLFGLVHFYLIWRGDILIFYAVFGFIATACIRWAAKTQLVVGLVGYALGILLVGSFALSPYLIAETSFGDQPDFPRHANSSRQTRQARWLRARPNIASSPRVHTSVRPIQPDRTCRRPAVRPVPVRFESIPLMLIGMALYRWGFFSGGLDLRKMLRWGLPGSFWAAWLRCWSRYGSRARFFPIGARWPRS